MREFAKTKIVATIGPSSWDKTILKDMIFNGMDVARINASFADFAELERVSKDIKELSSRVAIMLDTQGHKIRTTGFTNEIVLKNNDKVAIIPQNRIKKNETDNIHIRITYDTLHEDVSRSATILLDDGNIVLT
ncbi:MAG: Pyruvate kinase, partial [candidate division WS6 bacterium GW2011_GWB1_33_6]